MLLPLLLGASGNSGDVAATGTGAATTTGYAPSLRIAHVATPAAGALTETGQAVTATNGAVISPAAGALVETGQTPTTTVLAPVAISPAAGELVGTGQTPATSIYQPPITISPAAGSLVAAGETPTVLNAAPPVIISPAAGALVGAGTVPIPSVEVSGPKISVSSGSLSLLDPGPYDPYFNYVTVLAHCNATGYAEVGKDVFLQSVEISPSVYKFGGGSAWVNGTFGGYVQFVTSASTSLVNFGTNNFTIEWQLAFRTANSNAAIYLIWSSNGVSFEVVYDPLEAGGTLNIRVSGSVYASATGLNWSSRTVGNFFPLVLQQNSTAMQVWDNGTLIISAPRTTIPNFPTGANAVRFYVGSDSGMSFYLDELRVTNGVARYADTPPAQTAQWPYGSTAPQLSTVPQVFPAESVICFPGAGGLQTSQANTAPELAFLLSPVMTPAAAALSLTSGAPAVGREIDVSVRAVTLTGNAPTVTSQYATYDLDVQTVSIFTPEVVPVDYTLQVGSVAIDLSQDTQITDTLGVNGISQTMSFIVSNPTSIIISPAEGSLVATGYAGANTLPPAVISPSTGALSAVGQSVTLSTQITIASTSGTASVVGAAPLALVTALTTPASGGLSTTGYTPTVTVQTIGGIPVGVDDVALTGYAPALSTGYVITPPAGGATLSGQTPQLQQALFIPVNSGSATITGQAPSTYPQIIIPVGAGALAAGGVLPSVGSGTTASAGIVAATGYAPSLGTGIAVSVRTVAVAGSAPTLAVTVLAQTGALSAVATAPVVQQNYFVQPAANATAIVGQPPVVVRNIIVLPASGTLVATGQAPVASAQTPNQGATGVLAVQGQAVSVRVDAYIQAATRTVTLTGVTPSITVERRFIVSEGALTLQTHAATRLTAHVCTVASGSLFVSTYVPVRSTNTILSTGTSALAATGYVPQRVRNHIVQPDEAVLSYFVWAPSTPRLFSIGVGSGAVAFSGNGYTLGIADKFSFSLGTHIFSSGSSSWALIGMRESAVTTKDAFSYAAVRRHASVTTSPIQQSYVVTTTSNITI